jgi:adenosylmethionine-8-amino-7-oxononanoate aminotransferase
MAALSWFAGHPVAAAVALANIDLMEREERCAEDAALHGRELLL